MSARDKIIVLKTFKHGESDLIVHGLNPHGIRLSFFARGGLKSRKRFAGGVLEPTHYIEITYKPSSNPEGEGLHTLLEAQVIREFTGLRTDYDRLETALYLLRIVHRLSLQGGVDSEELFNLLGNALSVAEKSADLETLKVHFELKFLALQGVLPPEQEFSSWLKTPLARHELLREENVPWIREQSHERLRHYLGTY